MFLQKRGNIAKKRRNKILKFARGFKGAHSRLFRTANGQVTKALVYSYVGRKRRKKYTPTPGFSPACCVDVET